MREFSEEKVMVDRIKGFGDVKENNINELFLSKDLVPGISAVKEKCLC